MGAPSFTPVKDPLMGSIVDRYPYLYAIRVL